MRYKKLLKLLIINGLLLFSMAQSLACGYNWIGECATSIHLRINGTLDSFNLADCPSGIPYNGLYLGNLRTLSLANAHAITWESCQNNVSAVQLQYRLYEQGGVAGNFETWSLQQDFFTFDGTYTTRYRSHDGNLDLTPGLTIGKTYVLEVYFIAEIDTVGNDFIPETTLLANRGGQNYQLSFTYGGPDASPFVAIPTIIKEPNCFGENNGAIKISVWGNQTGLFYQWSNINLNFPQQNSLVAGTYSVTVSGVNHTATQEISLGQAPELSASFSNIFPIDCGGNLGAATVVPVGGTAPYRVTWQDGATSVTDSFPSAGSYAVSVLDAHNCLTINIVNIPTGATIPYAETAFLCAGDSIQVADTWIDAPGEYTFLVAGNGACDTLLSLTVNEVNPSLLLAMLPAERVLTCAQASVEFCAQNQANTQYAWSYNGIPAAIVPCLVADKAGIYALTVEQDGCLAHQNILVSSSFLAPEWVFFPSPASSDTSADGQIILEIMGGEMPYAVVWANGDTDVVLLDLLPGEYCVTVRGANGCQESGCVTIGVSVATTTMKAGEFGIWPNPVQAGATVQIQVPLTFEAHVVYLSVFDAQSKRIFSETYPSNKDGEYSFEMPFGTPAGGYSANIRGDLNQISVKIQVIE